jgi:hypothetical protein
MSEQRAARSVNPVILPVHIVTKLNLVNALT